MLLYRILKVLSIVIFNNWGKKQLKNIIFLKNVLAKFKSMCYSILYGYENTVKKRLSAKNGFTESSERAEIGASVAVCLSLWSG